MAESSVYQIQGQQVTLPVEVRDASSGNAMYLVDAAVAESLLPGDDFKLVEAAPGQTQLLLGIIDYRDNDLGDYGEVAIIFMVRPCGAGAEADGTFIYKLPVNQSFTCEAGCTIWGFPKTVETITFEYSDEAVSGRLEMDGAHVFTLSVPRGRAESTDPEMQTRTYTFLGGVPHETAFSTGGKGTALNPGGAGVGLTLGDHPSAQQLRSLGLADATPIVSTWTEHMTGCFGPAEKLQ